MECEYPPLLVRAAGSQLSVFRSRQLTSDYVLSAAVRFRFLFPAFSRRSRRVFLSALSSAVFIAERLSVKRSISRSRFSRLARNTQDLLRLVQRMQQKEIQLISCQEQIDTATATGKLMLTMIAAINEFERSILLERQKEGIAIAKREKRYQGRKRIQQPDSFELLYGRYRDHKVTKSEIARQLEISRPTVDRLIKEMETGHKGKS